MAALPSPLSPREVSPSCVGATDAMPSHHASIPGSAAGLLRSTSFPSRAASPAPQWAPSALLERRPKFSPSLKVSAFQGSNATASSKDGPCGAFLPGVGTTPYRSATLYDLLEVHPTATENEIKTAYRRLARQHHPDRGPLQEKEVRTTKFLQIHSAYAALSDAHARAQYDLQLSLPSNRSAGQQTPFSASNYCSPRTPYSAGRGRSWETDQCWC